jgi:predicted AAA+ superfamily ATPase
MAVYGTPSDLILPRALSRLYLTALETARVVVVTGPRQTGKSTFVQTHPETAGRPYYTLDDAQTLLALQ